MTDKEKIRAEVERLMNELIQEKEKGFGSDIDDACILELQNVLTFIDSMHEEPVSEDLDKFATQSANKLYPPEYEMADDNWKQRAGYVKGCKDGAKWQKQQLMKSAVKGVVHHFGDDEIAAIHYNDPKGIPMSYFVSSNDLKAGDNVKMITIKED